MVRGLRACPREHRYVSGKKKKYAVELPNKSSKIKPGKNKVTFGIREIKHDVIRQTANANNSVQIDR